MPENEDNRSPEEITAMIGKIEADTIKAQAEAAQAKALARKANAEADTAEVTANEHLLQEAQRKASDAQNHVYRFNTDVNSSAVDACIHRLSEWSRIDPNCDIEVVFNSPGGSIIDGFALFDHLLALRYAGHRVTTGTIGEAASMAGVLVQAGDVRWCGSQSWYLIHRAAFGNIGKTFEMEDQVKWVKRIEDRIVNIFTARSKLTDKVLRKEWERKDWWLDADQCLDLGIVDEVRGVKITVPQTV